MLQYVSDTTNKHLFKLQQKKDKKDKAIKITPAITRTLLKILKKGGYRSQYQQLKRKYEQKTGEKYRPK